MGSYGVWSSGGSLNTARGGQGGAGTQTAALSFGGYTGTVYTAASESFNGSSWTNTPSMNTARSLTAGAGSQTAALCAGGFSPPSTGPTDRDWETVKDSEAAV